MTTDIDRHGSLALELARRLAQYQANRGTLFDWMDPGWLDGAQQAGAGTTAARSRLRARAVDAWLADAGSPVPPFNAFRTDAALLGALPLEDALAGLCLRALHFRRAELRYWVDRESREKVAQWLGRGGGAALRWLIEIPHAPAADRLIREHGMEPLDSLDDYALSWEGFCLFSASGLCAPSTPAGLLRYAWPREAAAPRWLAACGAAERREDSLSVVRRLGDFYANVNAQWSTT
ncbi:MAG TPA: type III secretion protein HrpB4 [Paraburkholderia sp.]|nr:type III secretion protein HrpB4 [Paraburkholderia sp.]